MDWVSSDSGLKNGETQIKILYIVAFCFLYYNNVMQESKAENCETIINID